MKRVLSILLSLCAVISAYAQSTVVEIWTKADFEELRDRVNAGTDTYADKTVKLMADLYWGTNESSISWEPIGKEDVSSKNFSGTFDGQGYTITMYTSDNRTVAGLFGYLYTTANIKHLKVAGRITNTNTSTSSTAGIAAYNRGTISECANLATIVGTTAGGIAGENHGTITDCYNRGNIRATGGFTKYYLGGIAGANDNATISYTYASCTIDNVSTTGGITGNNIQDNNSGTVSNSYYNVLWDNGSSTYSMTGNTTLTGDALKSSFNNSKWTFTAGELPELTCFKNKIVRLSNTKNNNTILSNYKGQICSVELNGRTLYKDGAWNTLCLPFNVNDISTSCLADATIMELDVVNEDGTYQTGFDYKSATLNLYFKTARTIEAGKPYIIMWDSGTDLENPRFSNVTMANATGVPAPSEITSSDGKVSFIGNYSPVPLLGDDPSNLYMGTGIDDKGTEDTSDDVTYSTLYYPKTNKTMYSFRAYFHVDFSDPEAHIRAFNLHFEDEEGLTEVKAVRDVHEVNGDTWYTSFGMKLEEKPSVPGVYIYNGRKVMIQ